MSAVDRGAGVPMRNDNGLGMWNRHRRNFGRGMLIGPIRYKAALGQKLLKSASLKESC